MILGFYRIFWLVPSFTRFYLVLASFNRLNRSYGDFTLFLHALTGHNWVVASFTRLNRILGDFTECF